jgi:epoxyqueuosine reductase
VDAPVLTDRLLALGRDAGLDAVGVAPAGVFVETLAHLERRKADGLHGGMQFTYRCPERSTDPEVALPGARAIVVGAMAYRRTSTPPPAEAPQARVASYSWGDRYAPLRTALGVVAAELVASGWRGRVLADDNALVDREAAFRAGLGWYGKNTNLLLPGRGSWFVLGSVVTDAPLEACATPVADGCGSCQRCLPACPTGALVAPGVLDARRCLAHLVQAPGSFPVELRAALGDRLYGCDDCQDVCPENKAAERRHPPPPLSAGDEPWVAVLSVLHASDEELLHRYGRWYIPRRDPRYLRRNALVVLGNIGDGHDPEVVSVLRAALRRDDPLLREHAAWAAERLGRGDLIEEWPVPAAACS